MRQEGKKSARIKYTRARIVNLKKWLLGEIFSATQRTVWRAKQVCGKERERENVGVCLTQVRANPLLVVILQARKRYLFFLAALGSSSFSFLFSWCCQVSKHNRTQRRKILCYFHVCLCVEVFSWFCDFHSTNSNKRETYKLNTHQTHTRRDPEIFAAGHEEERIKKLYPHLLSNTGTCAGQVCQVSTNNIRNQYCKTLSFPPSLSLWYS